MINLDDKQNEGLYLVSLFIDRNTVVYFDFFRVEYVPQEVLDNIKDKSISCNIFRIQDNDSVMCAFHCIAFTEYKLAGKDYANLLSPNDYKNNDKTMYQYFKDKYDKRKRKPQL